MSADPLLISRRHAKHRSYCNPVGDDKRDLAMMAGADAVVRDSPEFAVRRRGRTPLVPLTVGALVLGGVVLAPVVAPILPAAALASLMPSPIQPVADRFGWGIKEVSFGFAYIGIMSTINQGFVVRRMLPKIGEKKMLIIGLSCLAVSLVGIAASTEIWMLAIVMTILSFGYSFTNPSTLGSISLLSSATEQGAVLGTTQGLAALGRILGPAFGGLVYQDVSQSAPFLSAAVLAAIAFFIVLSNYNQLPESAKHGVQPLH